MARRLALLIIVFVLAGCGGGADDATDALIPSLQAAETLVPRALVCPELDATEKEYRPLLEGTLEALEAEVPASLRERSTVAWVTGGARIKIGIWSDTNARPAAMMFVAELEDGSYALSKVRYCS